MGLARYNESDLFTEAEKLALSVADAMTQEPVEMSDDLFERVRTHFSDAQLVELSAHVALANVRSRMNAFFHVQSHGLCALPLPAAGAGHGQSPSL